MLDVRERGTRNGHKAVTKARQELRCRLVARRPEIEQALGTRLGAISAPGESSDPDYLERLQAALRAAFEYVLLGVELGERLTPTVPPALLLQARLAARNGVSLDTVLRRYLAGYAVLAEFVLDEAESGPTVQDVDLKPVLKGQAAIFDRLIAAVSEEYSREAAHRPESDDARRTVRVKRLLAGEPIDTSDLDYPLEGWHIAVLAEGALAKDAIHSLAAQAGTCFLVVGTEEGPTWAWLGSRRPADMGRVQQLCQAVACPDGRIAIGEAGEGLGAWRLSHYQARAAFKIAKQDGRTFVRYAEVAVLASTLRDDILGTSLVGLFLGPLSEERDGGASLRETLRAYFAADRNVSSTAAALHVSRRTVANRLQKIEQLLDRPLPTCALEVELALRLQDFREAMKA
jgi:hypothetical protein